MLALSGCNSAQNSAPMAQNPAPGAKSSKSGLKIALLTPGDINDQGWNQLAYDGLKGVEKLGGAQISNQVTKNASDFAPAIRDYADQNYDLVFCHGGEYETAVKTVAPAFLNTKFVIVAGNLKQAPNVATLVPKLEEATYLLGVVAGKMTQTGTIGVLGGKKFNSIQSTFDAFAAGARSANPKIRVLTKYTDSFEDQDRGKATARTLIAQGCDLIFHNADQSGNGMFVAAQEAAKSGKKVWVFGSNRNQNGVAPDVCLASAVIEMPKAFADIAASVRAEKFKPELVELNLQNGGIALEWNDALKSQIPAAVLKLVDETAGKIKAGKVKIERKV